MATVGWGLYTLAFDVLGVPGPEAALAALSAGGQNGSLALLAEGARLWLAVHALGVGLWLASRRTSHPALFPTFRAELTLGNAGDMMIVPGIEALSSAVDTEDN